MLTYLMKRIAFRVKLLIPELNGIVDLLSWTHRGKANDKIRLTKQNFGINYWQNRLSNLFCFICSEDTHEEHYMEDQLIK